MFVRTRISHPAAPAVAAALLSLLLYAVNLGGTYIYDDVQIIGADERVHSVAKWKEIWTRDYFNGGVDNLYRPLVSQSFAIQWWLHGDRPWAFHLVNILLSAAVCAAVAELARRLAGIKVAWIAGLLFAAHPVHVEAVAGIVGRCEESCALLICVAVILFLRAPMTPLRAASITLCAIAAELCKEQGMLLPVILLAVVFFTGRRWQSQREKSAMLLLAMGLCWATAGLIFMREQVLRLPFEWDARFLDVSIQPLVRSSRGEHALIVFALLGRYAQLLIAPVYLSIDYGMNVITGHENWRDPYLYAGLATAGVMSVFLILALLRGRKIEALCLIIAAMIYSMVSNVVIIGTIFGERLIYLPSIFLLIWGAIQLARLRLAALCWVLTPILLLGCVRAETYAWRWNDRLQFYQTSLAEQPKSVRLYELVTAELLGRGDMAGAARVAEQGRQAVPDYWNIWYMSGHIAEEQGDDRGALEMYRKAFNLQPMPSMDLKIRNLERKLKVEDEN